MQGEFDAESPALGIQIVGVNEINQEHGNEGMTDGRDLPWLQDVDLDENNLSDISRDLWQTIQRDVVILNADGEEVERYSLTANRLEEPDNYATLKHMIVDATTPWHNDSMPFDVNDDGAISPIDALQVINHLNSEGPGDLPVGKNLSPYLDTTGDNYVSPRDALVVINYLIEANNAAANTLAAETAVEHESVPRNSPADIDAAFAARIDLADTDVRFETDDERLKKQQ